MEASMKCLRIHSTADGESHFDQVEIPPSCRQVHPQATAFEVLANYATTRIRFTRIPSGARSRRQGDRVGLALLRCMSPKAAPRHILQRRAISEPVAFDPLADSALLFDHLVGERQQQAKCA
jgi:hypothetical protein